MTRPDDRSKPAPAERVRAILNSSQNDESPIKRLPRAKPAEEKPLTQTAPIRPSAPPAPKAEPVRRSFQFLPAFWTIASVISLTVNIILLVVLVVALRELQQVNLLPLGTNLVSGLYSNFEKMDAANIKTQIPVQATIPLNMSIPVQTTTNISLADPVEIPNAHVKISTGTLTIDSDADVTLPAKTNLNVILNFNVPVQTSVPVSLNVPVNIPLSSTELHPAITGLEATIKPLYCFLDPNALSINNSPVCK